MFDLIVVTAANEAQAKGYRAQLKGRRNFIVVPDPGNRRVGSLGATVNVLRGLLGGGKVKVKGEGEQRKGTSILHLQASPSPLTSPSPRILICHSGGDAKRTPGYAAMGKAFVPMTDGRPMLDHIVEAMEKLLAKSGVTVCCGDVIPYLDYGKVAFAPSGVTGVAYPDGPWQAQRHGVYVTSYPTRLASRAQAGAVTTPRREGASGTVPVTDFLQKPHVTRGKFLIDTGILHFDWRTAAKMTKLPIAGDIYEEFPKMLLEGFAPFHVAVVPTCDFFHIGSSRELLAKLGKRRLAACPRETVLIDGCAAPIGRLGGDNVVTNVPASYGTVNLKKGECLTSLPLGKDGWYHLKYHIDDNFKSDGLWEKHGLGEKMKKVNHARLLKLRTSGDNLWDGRSNTWNGHLARSDWGQLASVNGRDARSTKIGARSTKIDARSTKLDARSMKIDARSVAEVRVTAPVRIDFAGGWSDTPPICQQEGGTVLAAAVTLDGQLPIEVTVRLRKDTFVRVVSKDLGKRKVLKSAAEIADHHDPHDWCCLVKSALTVTGFKFGKYGLDITISADLPKGSGMGTSSILGAATIAALLEVAAPRERGRHGVDIARVGTLTLKLEQEMRTGGGWEDQFAGMTPGVKILRSKPGKNQVVDVEQLRLPAKFAKDLKARSLLYFTGQKRMARNVLRRVLSFYADNPHNFGQVLIDSVKKDAERSAQAVARGDMKTFAKCVNDYWRDKKLLDAGSTNEQVDDIIDAIRPFVSAVSLTGAGGGGFMYILAKSAADADKVREFLRRNPPSAASRFYAFDIDEQGMTVDVK